MAEVIKEAVIQDLTARGNDIYAAFNGKMTRLPCGGGLRKILALPQFFAMLADKFRQK